MPRPDLHELLDGIKRFFYENDVDRDYRHLPLLIERAVVLVLEDRRYADLSRIDLLLLLIQIDAHPELVDDMIDLSEMEGVSGMHENLMQLIRVCLVHLLMADDSIRETEADRQER